jgi:hypothetical protein
MDISISPSGDAYRPGACNIGPEEIARRRRSAYVLFAVSIVVAGALLVAGAPHVARWILALPLAAALVTWLQVRRRFCAAFGLGGIRNFGRLADRERVDRPEDRVADRAAALRLIRDGAVIGVVLTALFVLLPV